ncbi:MAG: type II toxin-antitoxin system prevent-host-death family antitoxin [Coriobacteriia bacterium]|nr:type II toxin-antitoxin system prevent-host-death family antitoxin [Coriobacteriia bacterium]
MSEIVNVYDAKARLSSLIDRALNGEAIIIAKRNQPLVKLAPITSSELFVGHLAKKGWIADNFDTTDVTDMFFGVPDENPI